MIPWQSALLIFTNFAWIISFFISYQAFGIDLHGTVEQKGTRKSLASVNVYLLPHKLKATTGTDGKFVIKDVPPGKAEWIINIAGYEKFVEPVEVNENSTDDDFHLYVEKSYYGALRTTIHGRAEKRDDTTKGLSQEEFLNAPASGGDPVKAVKNLPGIARTFSYSSAVVIQGSSPNDTSFTLNGHRLPLVFHFGGLTSVVFPEAIDQVQYLSAGYGPEYGRANGGLVGLTIRDPVEDKIHGTGFVDVFQSGALMEGPIDEKGDHRFIVAVRRSYFGEVIRAFVPKDSSLDLTVAPTYTDGLLMYSHRVNPTNRFRLSAIASDDVMELVFGGQEDSDVTGFKFYQRTSFFRLMPEWQSKIDSRSKLNLSLSLGRDWKHFEVFNAYFKDPRWVASGRIEYENELLPFWKTYFGIDSENTWFNVGVKGLSSDFEDEDGVTHIKATTYNTGIYLRNDITAGDTVTLMPSVRFDHFSATKRFHTMPRLAIRYKASPITTFRVASGIYYQPPTARQMSREFGNADLKSPRAYHGAIGTEFDFKQGHTDGIVWDLGAYYRYFDLQVANTDETVEIDGEDKPIRYNNEGKGTAYGFENLFKFKFAPISGWVSYTLSRGYRWKTGEAPSLFEYDQTHNLNFVAGVDLPKHWRISSRFRYVSGNPYTPVRFSTYDADNDFYRPIYGDHNSARYPDFWQLDLRFDKKWIFEAWVHSTYLDIQNATLRQNAEAYNYNYDYSDFTTFAPFPIVPTLGLKGEF